MLRLRVLLATACGFASVLMLGVQPASSVDANPVCQVGSFVTLQSQHFLVHYCNANDPGSLISESQAGDILGLAERSLATYESWGYPGPPLDTSDGDGLYDIYVKTPAALGFDSELIPDGLGAAIDINATAVNFHEIAHDVFHLVQLGVAPSFVHLGSSVPSDADLWLQEGTAEWAANTVTQTTTAAGAPDNSGDCVGEWCGAGTEDQSGHAGWTFFEYLAEQYGSGIIREIWNQAAADGSGPGTTPVDEVLASKGSSLQTAYGNYAAARLDPSNPNSAYALAVLKGQTPPVFSTVSTGTTSAAIPSRIVAVNHLASRYIALQPGDGTTGSVCYAADLALTITIPSGIPAQPWVFVNTTGSTPVAFNVSGSTATATIPWNTCTGGATAYVLLPNPSVSALANGAEFKLAGTLSVHTGTVAAPSQPPAQVDVNGNVVNVPTSATPPDIDVFGPEVIQLSAGATTLRLIVSSDTDGKVQASLGTYALGTATLRAGGNDVHFSLPGNALKLRRLAAASNVLRLTSVAPTGALGETVTRLVSVDQAKSKPKAKKTNKHVKPKAKKKTKNKSRH